MMIIEIGRIRAGDTTNKHSRIVADENGNIFLNLNNPAVRKELKEKANQYARKNLLGRTAASIKKEREARIARVKKQREKLFRAK